VNKYIREEILSINMNENGMFEDIEVGILSNIYLKTNETREREGESKGEGDREQGHAWHLVRQPHRLPIEM
jgi:hypothetical protein